MAHATFRSLDPVQILATLAKLRRRIEERFPDSGLAGVARDLEGLGAECATEATSLGLPNWSLRAIASLLLLLVLLGVGSVLARVWPGNSSFATLSEFVQAIDSAVNDAVFVGIAIWFFLSLERRLKRRIALRAIHQLRSVAHIVDMHQLTKDPERLMSPQPDTESSPTRVMTSDQLGRYLDYCSEMLSLTSKLAALYVQRFDDSMVLQAVNEVESLTNGLSRKVWQKITILEAAASKRDIVIKTREGTT
ncbi:MAG: hypothetical protein ABI877_10210 [Gemmatimonadaceae bacterium]